MDLRQVEGIKFDMQLLQLCCCCCAGLHAAHQPLPSGRRLLYSTQYKKYRVAQDPFDDSCVLYPAVQGDTLSAIASATGVPLAELVKLNKDIADTTRLGGQVVGICNIKSRWCFVLLGAAESAAQHNPMQCSLW